MSTTTSKTTTKTTTTSAAGAPPVLTALSDPAAEAAIQTACRTLLLPTVRAEAVAMATAAAKQRLSHKAFGKRDDGSVRIRIRALRLTSLGSRNTCKSEGS
jgi:hypothetical protein